MPLSRFIHDLDALLDVFNSGRPPGGRTFEDLRLAVTRMNEIRRQLAVAQDKLAASLSLAENDLVSDYVEPPVLEREMKDRFQVFDFCQTGIAEIDEEHRKLVELGNRLYALSFCEDVDAATMRELLTELITFAQRHFSAEERLMEAHGYPEVEAHRATHRRMFDYLAEMFELAQETPLLVSIRLEMFLGSWFVWHMQRDDNAFALHCRNGSAQAAAY